MINSDTLNIRVAARYASEEELADTTPAKGELIIYTKTNDDTNLPYLKVGDGLTPFPNLPCVAVEIGDLHQNPNEDLVIGLEKAEDFQEEAIKEDEA